MFVSEWIVPNDFWSNIEWMVLILFNEQIECKLEWMGIIALQGMMHMHDLDELVLMEGFNVRLIKVDGMNVFHVWLKWF